MTEFTPKIFEEHTSYVRKPQRKDSVFGFFELNVVGMCYDPDTDGWCGYNCFAWALFEMNQVFADGMGYRIRKMMGKTMQEHRALLIEFLTSSEYNDTLETLSMAPDESNAWWLTFPSCLWVALIAFGCPFLFAHVSYEKPLLFNMPDNPLVDTDIPFFLLDDNEHFRAYKIKHYTAGEENQSIEQPEFDRLFMCIYE